jgi:hypothetical protein
MAHAMVAHVYAAALIQELHAMLVQQDIMGNSWFCLLCWLYIIPSLFASPDTQHASIVWQQRVTGMEVRKTNC